MNTPTILRLRLEGAFGVAIQKGDSYRISAFTGRDPEHRFLINGQEVSYGQNDTFHFNLQSRGLKSYSQAPAVDPAFYWTNKSTPKWKYDPAHSFITLSLPCPEQIQQDCTSRVTFRDNSPGLMPRNHIFLYEITDFDQVQLHCHELGPYSPTAEGILQLELGLDPQNQDPQHPIMFYNNLVTTFFSDLGNESLLQSLDDANTAPYKLKPLTTTLECKAGGIIGQA